MHAQLNACIIIFYSKKICPPTPQLLSILSLFVVCSKFVSGLSLYFFFTSEWWCQLQEKSPIFLVFNPCPLFRSLTPLFIAKYHTYTIYMRLGLVNTFHIHSSLYTTKIQNKTKSSLIEHLL